MKHRLSRLLPLLLFMAVAAFPLHAEWSADGSSYYLRATDGYDKSIPAKSLFAFTVNPESSSYSGRDCGVSFTPAGEGEIIAITLEECNLEGDNYLLVYDDVLESMGKSGLSDGDGQSRYFPAGWKLKLTKADIGKTYMSPVESGALSIGMHTGYGGSNKPSFKFRVESVVPKDMEYVGATARTDMAGPRRGASAQVLAAFDVETSGINNPLSVEAMRINVTESPAAYSNMALRFGGATIATFEGGGLTIASPVKLSSGHNLFEVVADMQPDASGNLPAPVMVTLKVGGVDRGTIPAPSPAVANVIYMPAGPAVYTISGDARFYDDGGPDGNISEDFSGTVTFVPATAGSSIKVDVTKLELFNTSTTGYNDVFNFYNGRSVDAANLITTLLKEPRFVKSTAADGSMTVEFTSTTGIPKAGFEAVVSTFVPGPMTVSAVNSESPLAQDATVSADQAGVRGFMVDVLTDNTGNPLKVTGISLASELPAALKGVKVFYLGENSAAAPGQAIATADAAATMNLLFEKELLEGHNYFLIAFDTSTEIKTGDAVKLSIAGVTVGGNNVVPAGTTRLSLAVKNVCASTEGSHSHNLSGPWEFVPTMDGTKYKAGTTDQIVTFKPVTPGTIAQISFSDFHVTYSANSWGTKAVFEIYSGTDCNKDNLLWQLNSADLADLGPQQVLRSRTADGALTVKFNPSSSSSYYAAAGWHAEVKEFQNHDMTIIGSEVRQTATGDAPVGATDLRLIDFTLTAEGTLSAKNVKSVKLALTGHEALSTVKVYASLHDDRSTAVPFGTATAAAEVDVTGDFTLAEGSNYLWVEADVKADAVPETVIDVTLKSVTDAKGEVTPVDNGNPDGTQIVKMMLIEAAGSHEAEIRQTIMFYDDGGADGKMGSVMGGGKTATYTFIPVGDNKAIKIDAKSFSIGNGKIYVYSGRSVDEVNILGNITGYYTTSGPKELVSKAADGSMTLTIKNPTGKTLDGFALEISLHEKQPFALGDIAAGKCLATDKIVRGAVRVPLTRVSVNVSGDKGDCKVDELTFDVSDATVASTALYYGGTCDNFNANAATQLSAAVPADGKVTLTAGNDLGGNGTYYYFLVGDVKADAAADASVTSALKSVKFNGAATPVDAAEQTLTVRSGLAAGTYSIGSGKDYATIADATAALANGIEGPVTMEIADGTYNDCLILEDIQGTSEQSPLIIKSASGNRDAVTLKPSDGDYIVKVDHTPWVTIEGISIDATDGTFKTAVQLIDRSHHFTLKECALVGDRPMSSSGLSLLRSYYTFESELSQKYGTSTNGFNNDYVTVVDNLFTGGKDAIYLDGTGAVANLRHNGATVTGNTVTNPSGMAIYVMAVDDAVIEDNNVIVGEKGYSDTKGIRLNSVRNFSCVGNKVALTLSGKASNAISIYGKSGGYDGQRAIVANNDVVITNNMSYGYGMQIDNDSRNIDIVYNTIRNDGDGGYVYATSTANVNPVGMVLANNLMQNDVATASGTAYVAYFSNATDVDGYTIDHNVIYAANGQLLKLSTESANDIDAFNTSVKDAAKTNLIEQAKFADVTNQHLLEPGTSLATARAIANVKVDRDGRPRPAEGSTVGAYEYVPLSTEAPALAQGYPTVSAITENSADVKTKWTVAGKLYAKTIEWTETAAAPTVDDLLACEPVVTDENVELVTKLTGLKPETAYRTYLYSVSVLGNAGDVVSTETFTTLRHIEPLKLAVAPVAIEAGEEAAVAVEISGGDAPYTIEWRDRMNAVIGSEATVKVAPVMSQPYYVTVTSADGQTVKAKGVVAVTGDFFPATADDNYIAEESTLDPENDADTLYSGSLAFNGATMWYGTSSYWNGYTFSSQTSGDYTGLSDQYHSAPGGGYDSDNFIVAFPAGYTENYSIDVTNNAAGVNLKGAMITNSAYAYISMSKGDAYAKKFEQGDWFKLTVTGHHADGTTSDLDFYLADMRSSESSEQYIIDDWTWLDLRSLGDVVKLTFAFDSTDKSYGYLNTPSYFCLDNIGMLPAGEESAVTLNYGESLPLARFFEDAGAATVYSVIDCSDADVTPMLQLADGVVTIDSGDNDGQLDFDLIVEAKEAGEGDYATLHVSRLARVEDGLADVRLTEGVALYPVPVTDILNVATALEDYDVEIFATDGTLAMAERGLSGHAVIERGQLASGVYIVKVTAADGSVAAVRRIIVR